MATEDTIEAAVLERAKHNFINNGPSNQMWDDSSSHEGAAISSCFALSEGQRHEFIARARAEIENEESS